MENKDKNIQMADRRKQIEDLYGSDSGIRNIIRAGASRAGSALFTYEAVDRLLNQVGTTGINYDDIARLSEYVYATDSTYSSIIDYLANMYLWRNYFVPVLMREKANNAAYGEIYGLMTEVVDGLNIEVTFPIVLTKLLKEGVVYLYAVKNTSSKTISTLMLNPKYCKPVMMSQYGTGVFQFDAQYFDDLGARGEQLEEILLLFPDELVGYYREYKNGGPQYYIIDGRYSTYISLNDFNFPKYLTTIKSILDYHQYRSNEVERSSAQLDVILTHKIPTYENNLLFELPEVKALHGTMAKALANNKRTKLLTTFGEFEIHPLQKNDTIQNKTLENAHKAIFDAAGLNTNMFNGTTNESLLYSQVRDGSTVWKYVQQLVNFYNLTINNLFNFKGYQIEITMLPITHFNMKEMMETYRRNGEYGVGKLELIVASGTKQKHINHKYELEKFLKLDEILIPLRSSHTSSGESETEEIKPEEETEEDESEKK